MSTRFGRSLGETGVSWVRAFLLVLIASVAACGPAAGDRYAGLEVFDDSEGLYRVRYLAPPWELDESESGGGALRLTIAAEGDSLGSMRPPKFELQAEGSSRSPQSLLEQEERRVVAAGHTMIAGPRALTVDSGVQGQEILSFDPVATRFNRYVALAGTGDTAVFRFSSTVDLDSLEVDDMIAGFDVAPFEGASP